MERRGVTSRVARSSRVINERRRSGRGARTCSYIHTEGATIIDVADLMSACIDVVDALNIRLWGDTANDIQGGLKELTKDEE